jgi:hypothetical protein
MSKWRVYSYKDVEAKSFEEAYFKGTDKQAGLAITVVKILEDEKGGYPPKVAGGAKWLPQLIHFIQILGFPMTFYEMLGLPKEDMEGKMLGFGEDPSNVDLARELDD